MVYFVIKRIYVHRCITYFGITFKKLLTVVIFGALILKSFVTWACIF